MSAVQRMLDGLNQAATKNENRDQLLANAEEMGVALSRAKADKVANAYKRGRLDEMDPELMRVIGYSDPTGETAVNNYMREQARGKELAHV